MSELKGITVAKKYSEDMIYKIRSNLESKIEASSSLSIVTVGSFARREASGESDMDFFVIKNGQEDGQKEIEQLREVVQYLNIRMPASSGTFDGVVDFDDMVRNIGGEHDDTKTLTKRLLILLEGEWLFNEVKFNALIEKLLQTYVKDTITQHQLCRFLLNDLIRYYRTIGVDFENKTNEGGKAWGDRNIKLMFSRKMLYFSGILAVAETAQQTAATKREILKKYLRKTPIERVSDICGARANNALKMYDEFTQQMALPETRKMLKETTIDQKQHSSEFRNLKNMGHHFSWELSRLLSETYDASHPIHLAIKF
jgi:predicted nucleotidyltransferase